MIMSKREESRTCKTLSDAWHVISVGDAAWRRMAVQDSLSRPSSPWSIRSVATCAAIDVEFGHRRPSCHRRLLPRKVARLDLRIQRGLGRPRSSTACARQVLYVYRSGVSVDPSLRHFAFDAGAAVRDIRLHFTSWRPRAAPKPTPTSQPIPTARQSTHALGPPVC